MKSYGVTIHMKVTTSLLLNKCSPPSVPRIQCSNVGKQQNMQLSSQTLSFVQHWIGTEGGGERGREEKKKRLKVVAFPTLFTISSDFSTLRNMLFQTQGNLSLHFDLGPLES